MEQKKVLIQINNLSFKYPSRDYLFEDLKLTVMQGDRIALVGPNGSGKSTLLKILTGKIVAEESDFTATSTAYYVPQIDLSIHQSDLPIYEYISGFYDEWWDVLTELENLFKLSLNSEALTKTLSGGELMKLNLAIAVKHNPDVLILDEPTNHLDIKSVNTLIEFIKADVKDKYTYVIVSHDIYFLDQVVTTVWELDDKKVTTYGGNYTFYKEQKALHLRGIKRQLGVAQDALNRANKLEQQEAEKQAKKANEAKRAFIKGSIDKRAFNEGKNAASALQKNKSDILVRLKEEAEEKLEELETEERRLAFIHMKNTSANVNRTIFEIKSGTLKLAGKKLITDINLKLTYGDRVLISGDNGSGKTSLIKSILKKSTNKVKVKVESEASLEGEVTFGDGLAWVYIDQQYSLIDPKLTLIENLLNYNNFITEAKAKEQLGKFQFKTDAELYKLATHLSGGEMVRLIMAMITSFPIDLVILDEPTNNLDVETVEVLIKSLNLFKGAIIVVSHNIDFITRINVQRGLIIKNHKLREMENALAGKDAFFKALTSP